MAIRKIVEIGEEKLRKQCKPVEKFDLRLRILLKDMADTMYKAEGVGLAAPQVGILRRVVVVDIGEAMRYESHPELAVEGSFTREEMTAEVARLRALGFEVVPKLNFSTCHDVWMKEYSRMVSTPTYYRVCKELIDEVCEVFRPKYFHLGMDEERAGAQRFQTLAIMRQYDLWWHDLYYLVDCVERNNVRAWVWSDYVWKHTDEFIAKMPKSVLQRANQVLSQLEAQNQRDAISKPLQGLAQSREGYQLSLFQLDDPVLASIRDEIKNVDINNLTPIEALNKLNEIKKIITGKS